MESQLEIIQTEKSQTQKIKAQTLIFYLNLAKIEEHPVRVFADKLNNPLFCVIDIINILNIGIQEKIYIDVKSDCQEHVDPEKYDIPFSNEKNKLRCVLINELGALRLIFSKSTEPALQLQMFFLDKMHQIKNQTIILQELITIERQHQLMLEAESYKAICEKQKEVAQKLIEDDKIVHKLDDEIHNQYLILLRIVIRGTVSYQTLRCNKYNLDVKIAQQQKRVDTRQISSFQCIYQERNGNPVQFWKLVWSLCHKEFILGNKKKKLFFQLKDGKTEQQLLDLIHQIKIDNNKKIIQ